MNSFETNDKASNGLRGLWPIVLEEEIRAIDYYQPVLGLPDTIKAKEINTLREDLIRTELNTLSEENQMVKFDFDEVYCFDVNPSLSRQTIKTLESF